MRRVLRRLNRFIELIHARKGDAVEGGSRINAAQEMLEELKDIQPPSGPLESAFPVRPGWLEGQLGSADVQLPQIAPQVAHLDRLWDGLLDIYSVRPVRGASDYTRRGFAMLDGDRLMPKDSEQPGTGERQFTLELRSQASGDATLLRCVCKVGPLALRGDDDVLDDLYELQRALRHAKVCVRRADEHKDDVTIEGDLLFHPDTTQLEEIVLLVSRNVAAAATVWKHLFEAKEPALRGLRRRA